MTGFQLHQGISGLNVLTIAVPMKGVGRFLVTHVSLLYQVMMVVRVGDAVVKLYFVLTVLLEALPVSYRLGYNRPINLNEVANDEQPHGD